MFPKVFKLIVSLALFIFGSYQIYDSYTGNGIFQAPWSASGLPTVTLPSGLSTKGLPFGMQLIGRSFGADDLLERASWCESRIGLALLPSV